jgi:hypothetical protein
VILTASLYLASKINEFDKIRIRDFLNVTLYSFNEHKFIQDVLKDKNLERSMELEEGIYLFVDEKSGIKRVFNDFSKNKFKFMPAS